MRAMGLGKKGIEEKVIVIVLFSLIILIVLVMLSGKMIEWINMIIDKIFGF